MNYEDGEIAEVSSPIVNDNVDATSPQKKHTNDHYIQSGGK